MNEKPKVSSSMAQKELDKAEKQFEKFDSEVKSMTLDRMNQTPKLEEESQTKLSTNEIEKSKDIYLKPQRTISCKEQFNERFRDQYNFDKEYVHIIAEHKEIIGENIEMWSRPYPGLPAEFWEIPTNKPVWVPRYLAEQIKSRCYHRLVMQQTTRSSDGVGQFYGNLAVDSTVARLDARPINQRKSIFMGGNNF